MNQVNLILWSWFILGLCYINKKPNNVLSSHHFFRKPTRTQRRPSLNYCNTFAHHQTSSHIKSTHLIHPPTAHSSPFPVGVCVSLKWFLLPHESVLPPTSPPSCPLNTLAYEIFSVWSSSFENALTCIVWPSDWSLVLRSDSPPLSWAVTHKTSPSSGNITKLWTTLSSQADCTLLCGS